MLLASSLPLSSLIQPAEAQTAMSFRTTEPAFSEEPGREQRQTTLTFDAQGTTSYAYPHIGRITNGTFQISSYPDERILTSGDIRHGQFSNSGDEPSIIMTSIVDGVLYTISTECRMMAGNEISVLAGGQNTSTFLGPVECSPSEGGGDGTTTTTTTTTTEQESSSTSNTTATVTVTTTQEDGDGDGILDANDNCPNLPHTRCFMEIQQ
jgi:hypothetical protein